MPGLGAFALAGAVGGAGQALIDRARQQREDALRELERQNAREDYQMRRADALSDYERQRGDKLADEQRVLDREEQKLSRAANVYESLFGTESGGNFGAQNDEGYTGRSQFGQDRLDDFSSATGAPRINIETFRSDEKLQEKVEQWHFGDINNFIDQNGLMKYDGQNIAGVPITRSGMIAIAHLGGKGGLKRFLETNGQYNPADSNGTSLSDYARTHGGLSTDMTNVWRVLVDPSTPESVRDDIRESVGLGGPGPEYRILSAKEATAMGLPPGSYQRGADGRVTSIGGARTNITLNTGADGIDYGDPEKGLVWQRDENGQVKVDERGAPIAIPYVGGSVHSEQMASEAKADEREADKQVAAAIVSDDISRIRTIVNGSPEFPLVGTTTTGFLGGLLSNIDQTQAGSVANMLTTIKSNIGFDKLQNMRENSPTGGALGQVSNFENRLMQAVFGSLEQAQNREQFLYNLERVDAIYNRIIHQGISEAEAGELLRQIELPTAPTSTTVETSPLRAPAVGAIEDGYEYIGGDPANPDSWRRTQ